MFLARKLGASGLAGVRATGKRSATSIVGARLAMGGSGGSGNGGGRGLVRVASGGGGPGDNSKKGLWGMYLNFLDTQPLLSRSLTCGVLNGLGDIFSQLFVEGNSSVDLKRLGIFTAVGTLFIGPVLAMWYSWLSGAITGTITSVLVDQFLFAPVFIASIMSLLTAVDGKPEQIMPKLRQDWPDALKVNWILWIPAQYINFRFVPPNLRTLAVNVVALIWNVYMSFQSHKTVEVTA